MDSNANIETGMAFNKKKKRRWLNGKFSKMATFDSGYGTDNMRNRVVILRCGNNMEFD